MSNTYSDFPQSPSNAPAEIVEHRLQFTGSGSEYFRIWIVNLLLSILTLGIYSAWAKVRREQYFHRNTILDGSGFDYHGDPKAILKGRIIAVALLLILAGIDKLWHEWYFLALLLLMPLLPWMMIRSFIFRARNTSFRGLHFDFRGTYLQFCKALAIPILIFLSVSIAFLLLSKDGINTSSTHSTGQTEQSLKTASVCDDDDDDDDDDEHSSWRASDTDASDSSDADLRRLLEALSKKNSGNTKAPEMTKGQQIIFSLFLLLLPIFIVLTPMIQHRIRFFQFNHLKFGTSAFTAKFTLLDFYGAYARTVFLLPLATIVVIAGVVVVSVIVFGILGALIGSGDSGGKMGLAVGGFAAIPCYMALVIVSPVYLRALMTNRVWNGNRLDQHRFVSDQRFWGLCKVVLPNWLLMVLTLGLYWPWAQVRLAAYRASHTAVLAAGNLDSFIAGATHEKGAVGEEIADVFDFDVGF